VSTNFVPFGRKHTEFEWSPQLKECPQSPNPNGTIKDHNIKNQQANVNALFANTNNGRGCYIF
jgi:hypothetical protein